jgi:hypothetical protein
MKQLKIFKQNVQEKFSRDLNILSSDFQVKEKKFIKEMVSGILQSRSSIVRKIAQSREETISLEKVCERFRRHLSKKELADKLSENLLIKECRKLTKDSLIIFDTSDIRKNYAEKMEGLTKIYDADKKETCSGYNILDAVSVETIGNEFSISPLFSELHTNAEAVGSLKQATFDRINDIQVFSGNKGIFIMDRGYDDRRVIENLSNNDASYIIRSKAVRHLYYENTEQPFKTVAKKIKLKHRYESGNAKMITGIAKVGIRLDPYPKKKNVNIASTYLITARYIQKDKYGKDCPKGFFHLYCSFPDKDMTEQEMIETALRGYRIRWKIEEVHRHIKGSYAWEDMQVMTWDRLVCLNALLLIAISFLYSLDKYRMILANIYPHLMLDKKNKLNILKHFIYYRISLVVTEIFREWKLYKKIPFKNVWADNMQMTIF